LMKAWNITKEQVLKDMREMQRRRVEARLRFAIRMEKKRKEHMQKLIKAKKARYKQLRFEAKRRAQRK
jgi:hypothetical protein